MKKEIEARIKNQATFIESLKQFEDFKNLKEGVQKSGNIYLDTWNMKIKDCQFVLYTDSDNEFIHIAVFDLKTDNGAVGVLWSQEWSFTETIENFKMLLLSLSKNPEGYFRGE